MAGRVLMPVGFREKPEQLRAMCTFLKRLGTAEVVLVHVGPSTRGTGEQDTDYIAMSFRKRSILSHIRVKRF